MVDSFPKKPDCPKCHQFYHLHPKSPTSIIPDKNPQEVRSCTPGIVCFLACTALKNKFCYDDSLDAFGVHGVGGTLGAILTGVFATRAVWDIGEGEPLGLIEGGTVLAGQLSATAIAWALAIVVTFILLKVLDGTMGLRVSAEQEVEGLDLSQHGEEGYLFI